MNQPSKILVIDDEPDLRKILEINLRHKNYHVLTAINGKEGLRIASEETPDLILLDMMMPGMDGNEVCRQLKQNTSTQTIPIIFLTAKESMESKLEGFESGAIDYVVKPFEMLELEARIASQLKIQELHSAVEDYVKQINTDLELARKVQKSILPHHIPYLKGVNIATDYFATEKVGGDYYDIVPLNEEELALLITDVSGHGISAAFLTAMAKMAFKHSLGKGLTLDKILDKINRDFLDIIQTDHYLTGFLCQYNRRTKVLHYAKAGHLNQFLYKKSTHEFIELQTSGYFIGTFKQGHYEQKSISLNEGDKLILFTDGLIECKNKQGEPFGTQRLKDCIAEGKELDSHALMGLILEEQSGHIHNQEREDDYSLVIMEVNESSVFERLITHCDYLRNKNINIECFTYPENFNKQIDEWLTYLETQGYPNQFLKNLRICSKVLLHHFHKTLESTGDSVRMIWQTHKGTLNLTFFACHQNEILIKAEKESVQSQLQKESPAFNKMLLEVFSMVHFFNKGNSLRLLAKNQ